MGTPKEEFDKRMATPPEAVVVKNFKDMTPEEQLAIRMGGPIAATATLSGKKIFETELQNDGTDKVVFDELEVPDVT